MSRIISFVCGAATALRIVAGKGEPPIGAHTLMAIRIADAARDLGFRSVGIRSSYVRNSTSRYILATDAADRVWKIRCANHHRPERSAVPNLDLISVDGTGGLDDAREFLRRVAAGDVPWFDSAATYTPVSEKLKKRIRRCR